MKENSGSKESSKRLAPPTSTSDEWLLLKSMSEVALVSWTYVLAHGRKEAIEPNLKNVHVGRNLCTISRGREFELFSQSPETHLKQGTGQRLVHDDL